MKKLVTITTLTAGLGASLFGTTTNAHAAEYTHDEQHQPCGHQQQGNQPHQPMNNDFREHNNQSNHFKYQPQRPFNYYRNHTSNPDTRTHTWNNTTTTSPSYSDSSSSSSSSSSSKTSSKTTSSSSGNLYTAGQCTWYVYDKVGGKIGSTWGNANNWATAAQSSGYTVNHTPEKGSILQSSAGAYGHVAYVESVGSDGSVTVSEMNYNGGPYVVDTRTISSSEASSYNYIHLD